MIETSDAIDALSDAMAKAQATIAGAKKDSSNPHFKSRYADLASVWEAWQAVGPKQGLAVMQFPGECVNNQMAMTTLLTHASGQWIKATLSIPLAKVDAQGYGSATTYARRYALAAAVGIAPEDDDGNAASNPKGAVNDAKPRERLAGPHTSLTALKTAMHEADREIRSCGDAGQLEGYLATKSFKELRTQLDRDAPHFLYGGDELPAEYEPLKGLVDRLRKDFEDLETANHMADLART